MARTERVIRREVRVAPERISRTTMFILGVAGLLLLSLFSGLMFLAFGPETSIIDRITSSEAPVSNGASVGYIPEDTPFPTRVPVEETVSPADWPVFDVLPYTVRIEKKEIPWESIFAEILGGKGIVGSRVKTSDLLPPSTGASGDGKAFLANVGTEKSNYLEHAFTLDINSKLWIKTEGFSNYVSEAHGLGAMTENDVLSLFWETQPEPWVFAYWRTDIPLSVLKDEGLIP